MIFYLFSLLLAVGALTLLVVFAAIKGQTMHVVGFSLYGASLVLFYLIRTLYVQAHNESPSKAKLQKLDHTMIYILTAATYTPVALLLPRPAWGWSIFGVIWGLALTASLFRFKDWFNKKTVTTSFYCAALILDIVAFSVVHSFLSPVAIFWFSLGGLLYLTETLLVVFRPKVPALSLFKAHETFAFPFMITGSFSHFWAFFNYVL